MIFRYTNLINLPVFELQNQTRLGIVEDLIIDKTGRKIYGLLIKNTGFFGGPPSIILNVDIAQTLEEVVLVGDNSALIPLLESLPAKELYEKKNFGLDQKIETESGQFLGKVYDYLFDDSTLRVTKFYAHDFFKEFVLQSEDIIQFQGKKIIVKDRLKTIKLTGNKPATAKGSF